MNFEQALHTVSRQMQTAATYRQRQLAGISKSVDRIREKQKRGEPLDDLERAVAIQYGIGR